jgi:SWI/SNF-related matrix-associated actin-dependent regulator 1 of chromatin subfamily A
MDTDGYISSTGDNIQFHTSSEQLGQDVKFIVNSLGGTAKISSRIPTYIHKGIKKIGKKAYTLDINLPDSIIPFRLNRKICKLHKVKKYIPYRAFKSVEYIGQLPMQCIKTSSSDGLYVTDDCIVTHNSGESIAAVETLGAYPCLIICPASLKLNWKKEIALWLDKSVKVVDGLIKINYETIHGKKVVFGYETPDYNADFVIINYDILSREKKVVNAFKPDNIEIPNHKDLLKQVGFKSIIVDESHMCFPYNTMIQTKIGKLKIGDIVENKIDVPILSYDLKNKKLEYKKIEHFYTNGISKRTFLKIFHTYGYIILTDNHKIYVEGKGYVKASEIKKNDRVRILPQYIREQTERENTTEVLFEEMCNCNDTEFTGNNKQNERSEKTIGEKNLSCVSEGIPIVFDRKNFKKKNLLFKQLRNKIKMVRFKFCRKNKKSSEQVIGAFIENDKKGSYVKSSVGNRNFESNEIKQFDEKGGNQEKSFSKITRKDIFIKRLKSNWTNYTTIKISNGIRSIIGGFRIYYNNWKCKIIFQISSKFLSGGHCISKDKSGHRSRWKRTQSKEMEIFRPKKNGNFEFSWVEGIEILEQRDYGQYGISEKKDRIYNLEINKNNNYFAENILVSNCSNHKSLRTKAVKEISRKIRYRYALSGTPILNRPKELIAQLDFLDRLETLGGFWTFAKRYCSAFEGPFGWDFSGASNLDELHENMKKTCFIRRKKEDVLEELPPKQRIFLPVELSNLKEYENASKNFRNWMKMNMMNELEYYEELKNTTLLTDSQRKMIAAVKVTQKLNKTLAAEALVKIEKLKQVVARGKLLKVYEFIDNFLLYDEKLLIFAKHKEIYDKLIDKYKDISVHIIGGMTSKQKDKSVEEFQNNPNVKLFIGALDAAGVGLNLTQSSTVAFVELGWTSAIHDQAEDRAHRIGQKDFVKCYYFYTEKTIDEQILELIEKKRNITANISDGITIPQDSASNDDITEILSKFI